MYYCRDCNKYFDYSNLEIYKEYSEAWGREVYEEFLLCPECGEIVCDNIPCLNCDNVKECTEFFIEEEVPLCELGMNYLSIIEERAKEYE